MRGVDGFLLVAVNGDDVLLAMRGSCVTDPMAMIGSEEVVGDVDVREGELKLSKDPHVGTHSEVMRTTITPDVEDVNTNEMLLLEEVTHYTSNKFDIKFIPCGGASFSASGPPEEGS